MVESPSASAGGLSEAGSIPASGRSPGGGQGDPVQCSCPENPTDRGAWWAAVQGVTQSWARLKPRVYPDCWGKGGREAGGRMRRKEGRDRESGGGKQAEELGPQQNRNKSEHTLLHATTEVCKISSETALSMCESIYQNFFGPVAQTLKPLPAMLDTWVRSLGQEDPLEKEMATHSSILAWRLPSAEEPGGLQSMRSQRVGHD